MSKDQIEKLLLEAIDKLKTLEDSHAEEVERLEGRISYLEEMLSSQKNMLNDTVSWIKQQESDNGKKEA